MTELLDAVKDTPVPTILVVVGLAFILLAFAGRIAGRVEIPRERQKWIGVAGAAILVVGTGLSFIPAPAGRPITEAPTPSPNGGQAAAPFVPVPIDPVPTIGPTSVLDPTTASVENLANGTPIPTPKEFQFQRIDNHNVIDPIGKRWEKFMTGPSVAGIYVSLNFDHLGDFFVLRLNETLTGEVGGEVVDGSWNLKGDQIALAWAVRTD